MEFYHNTLTAIERNQLAVNALPDKWLPWNTQQMNQALHSSRML